MNQLFISYRRDDSGEVAGGGTFQARNFAGPFASSFWVRDGGSLGHEAAHVAITLYGDDRTFPAVRFGALSNDVVRNLSEHFEYLWQRSTNALAE